MTTISSGISGSSSWGSMQPPRMEGRGGKPSFSKIDTDGNGGLDKTELQSMLDKGPQGVQGSGSTDDLFSKLDSDGDGSISQSELDTGMKPPERDDSNSQNNGFGGMGMDTQTFANMMGEGTCSTPSNDETQQALFDLIDSDQSGDISKTEVSSFQDKMKALLEKMQQMGAQQFSSETNSVSLTA